MYATKPDALLQGNPGWGTTSERSFLLFVHALSYTAVNTRTRELLRGMGLCFSFFLFVSFSSMLIQSTYRRKLFYQPSRIVPNEQKPFLCPMKPIHSQPAGRPRGIDYLARGTTQTFFESWIIPNTNHRRVVFGPDVDVDVEP